MTGTEKSFLCVLQITEKVELQYYLQFEKKSEVFMFRDLGVRKNSDNFLNAIQMFTRIHFTNLVAQMLGNNL